MSKSCSLLLIFLFLLGFGQMSKKDQYIYCRIKKLTTYCLEKPNNIISQIPFSEKGKSFGRYKDLKYELSEFQLKQLKDNVKCYYKDSLRYNQGDYPRLQWSYDERDNYPFHYLYSQYLFYKGTIENIKFPEYYKYDSTSNKNYTIFYNKEHENNKNYEVFFNFLDYKGNLIYTFHQRENEFDEFTYEETENHSFYNKKIYKNGELYSETEIEINYENGNTKETKEYNIVESYVFNKKGIPVLVKSKFAKEKNRCNCDKGYVTKIKYQPEDICEKQIIFD